MHTCNCCCLCVTSTVYTVSLQHTSINRNSTVLTICKGFFVFSLRGREAACRKGFTALHGTAESSHDSEHGSECRQPASSTAALH